MICITDLASVITSAIHDGIRKVIANKVKDGEE